jgi:hypothetical protein
MARKGFTSMVSLIITFLVSAASVERLFLQNSWEAFAG